MSKKMKSIVNWENFDDEFSNFNNSIYILFRLVITPFILINTLGSINHLMVKYIIVVIFIGLYGLSVYWSKSLIIKNCNILKKLSESKST